MIEQIEEPIEVLAAFSGGKLVPVLFHWRNQRYQNLKVTAIRFEFEEKSKKIYFCVIINKVNLFELCFFTHDLQWRLIRIHHE